MAARYSATMFSNANARAHITALAVEHGITLTWSSGWHDAESWPSTREATVPVIRRARDYLIAMHEVGHILSPQSRRLGTRYDSGGSMACEAWAWGWAIDNADPALLLSTPWRDWELTGQALGSYIEFQARTRLNPSATVGEAPPDRPAA